MSDKRPHIKPEALAGLIRQYLAGELDDKAMHDLERQALDDSFLADALEGYAQHSPEQQAQQADLESRLAARIAPKESKVRTMYYRWAAAAAILLLMITAGWFLIEQQRTPAPVAGVPLPVPPPVADSAPQGERNEAPALASADHLTKKVTPPVPAEPNTYKLKEQNATLSAADDAADKNTAPAAASVQPAPAPVQPAPVPLALNQEADKAAPLKAEDAERRAFNNNYVLPPAKHQKERANASQWNGLNLSDSQPKASNDVVVGYGTQKKAAQQNQQIIIRGMSTEKADSGTRVEQALSGRVAGVSTAKQNQQVRIRGMSTVKADSNSRLEEVVVTGLGRNSDSRTDDETAYHAPSPVTGQTAFDNYLRTKTVNPENKYNGTVRVSFTVMPDGSLQDFKILRHLNDACDAEAIRVIKEGPAWIPASDRKPAKVKVRVKFTAPKH